MNFEALNSIPNAGQGKTLQEMKRKEPEMMEALEEDLSNFHRRIEKSNTWWCPGLQGTITSARKKVLDELLIMSEYYCARQISLINAQVTSHPPVTLYVGDIPPGLNEQGLRHTFQPYGDLLSVNIVRCISS